MSGTFLLVITRQIVCVCFCIEFVVVVDWIKACRSGCL